MDKGFAEMNWEGYEKALDDSAELRRIARLEHRRNLRQALAPTLRRPFNLNDAESLALLHSALAARQSPPPALLIIDPVTAFIGTDDASSSRAARSALTNLTDIALAADIAILILTHLTKNPRAKTIHRTAGALSWITASRVAYILENTTNTGPATLSLIKSNIPLHQTPLHFAINPPAPASPTAPTNFSPTPPTNWSTPTIPPPPPPNPNTNTNANANPISNAHLRITEIQAAETFLRTLLANGPLPMSEVENAARGNAFSLATLRRAKQNLYVASSRAPGDTRWIWTLPNSETPTATLVQ